MLLATGAETAKVSWISGSHAPHANDRGQPTTRVTHHDSKSRAATSRTTQITWAVDSDTAASGSMTMAAAGG